jgi:hypothetical protein
MIRLNREWIPHQVRDDTLWIRIARVTIVIPDTDQESTGWLLVVSLPNLFFFLDKKEPKNQGLKQIFKKF